MKKRDDVKSLKGLELRKYLGFSVSYYEIEIQNKRCVSSQGEDGLSIPDTYYVQDSSGIWLLVPRKPIYDLLLVGASYIVPVISNTVLGIIDKAEVM